VIVNTLARRIEARADELCLPLDARLTERLEQYWGLLAKWNRRVNLTALPLDSYPTHSVDRLLIEPLVAAAALDVLSSGATWLDFGSGGGSPAVPVKLVRPSAVLRMVESRSRKCAFLREVVQALGLRHTDVVSSRIEELSSDYEGWADVVTVRAVKIDRQLAAKVRWALRRGGTLALFGTPAARVAPVPELLYESSIPLGSARSELHTFKNRQ
jgi:16S rRNA (guanine527-N7)-methyltransferase